VELQEQFILVLGGVLRNEAIQPVEEPYLQELGDEGLETEGEALLTVAIVRNVAIAVEELVRELEVHTLVHPEVQLPEEATTSRISRWVRIFSQAGIALLRYGAEPPARQDQPSS
jgi:hypothetical protein